MTDTMIELGKRAVACPKWRWMPGMLTTEGTRIVHDPSRFPGRACALRDGGWTPRLLNPGALPDLTDPATVGCLLALVREAWGDPRAYVRASFGWEWITDYCAEKWPPGGETEAEALVAALEAAP